MLKIDALISFLYLSKGKGSVWIYGTLLVLCTSCVGAPPLREYALAKSALEAARDHEAARFAPGYWHRAEEAYRQGQTRFVAQEFGSAKDSFESARQLAEKSENVARYKSSISGGF